MAGAAVDAVAMRTAALGFVTALLIGLVGAVLGGWTASGEPMRIGGRLYRDVEHKRRRDIAA